MGTPSWLERLKTRWKLNSIYQVIIVLIVFACTGITVLAIKKPVLHFLAGAEGDSAIATTLYYILILPVYNVILLAYGFLFGQFSFFWEFEKRSAARISSWLKRNKK